MVEYVDGSIMAQLFDDGPEFPIQYALLYPERVRRAVRRASILARFARLDFLPVDPQRFLPSASPRRLPHRRSMPAVLNAATKWPSKFPGGELPFTAIVHRDRVARSARRIGRTVGSSTTPFAGRMGPAMRTRNDVP